MSKKNPTLATISRLVSFLEKLSNQQLEEIELGTCEVKFKLVKKETVRVIKVPIEKKVRNNVDLIAALNEMSVMKDREEVEQYLNAHFPSRLGLFSIARVLDIPVSKKDTVERMKSKIVEGTIGFKLRSQAIQLSGKNNEEI